MKKPTCPDKETVLVLQLLAKPYFYFFQVKTCVVFYCVLNKGLILLHILILVQRLLIIKQQSYK